MANGTTTECGPDCDELLAAVNGQQRHSYILHYVRLRSEGARGPKSKAAKAAKCASGSATAIHKDSLCQRVLDLHSSPRDQDSVDAKQAMIDACEAEVGFDRTLLFIAGVNAKNFKKLLLHIIEGHRDPSRDGAEPITTDFEGTLHTAHTYRGGHRPPTPESVEPFARGLYPWQLKSPEEIRELGVGKIIESVEQSNRGVKITLTSRHPTRALAAQMRGFLEVRATTEQLEAHGGLIARLYQADQAPALKAVEDGPVAAAAWCKARIGQLNDSAGLESIAAKDECGWADVQVVLVRAMTEAVAAVTGAG